MFLNLSLLPLNSSCKVTYAQVAMLLVSARKVVKSNHWLYASLRFHCHTQLENYCWICDTCRCRYSHRHRREQLISATLHHLCSVAVYPQGLFGYECSVSPGQVSVPSVASSDELLNNEFTLSSQNRSGSSWKLFQGFLLRLTFFNTVLKTGCFYLHTLISV